MPSTITVDLLRLQYPKPGSGGYTVGGAACLQWNGGPSRPTVGQVAEALRGLNPTLSKARAEKYAQAISQYESKGEWHHAWSILDVALIWEGEFG